MTSSAQDAGRLAFVASRLIFMVTGCFGLLNPSLALPAADGQAYRCGTKDSAAAYSQQPCDTRPDLIKVADERTAAQTRQAQTAMKQDIQLANAVQRQRAHAEKKSSQVPARALTRPARHHTKVQAPTSANASPLSTTQRLRRPRHFTAVVPKAEAKGKPASP